MNYYVSYILIIHKLKIIKLYSDAVRCIQDITFLFFIIHLPILYNMCLKIFENHNLI